MPKPPRAATEVAQSVNSHEIRSQHLAAVNRELASGLAVSNQTLETLYRYHSWANPGEEYWEALGGQPGSWFAALAAPSLPSFQRTPDVDSWVSRLMAQAPPEVWETRKTGAITPKPLADLADSANVLDVRFHAAITQLVEDALARLLRRAGLQVLTSIRDPRLRDTFMHLAISDVVGAAHRTVVRAGVTAMAVAAVDLESYISQAEASLATDLEDLLRRFETEAKDLVEEGLGTVDPTPSIDIPSAVALAVALFTARARRALDPEPIPGSVELEIGESGPGNIGAGLASQVLATASGGDGGQGTGVFVGALVRASLPLVPTLPEPPRAAADVAAQVSLGRGLLVTRLTWNHGKFGRPGTPFPPHRALDGRAVGTPEWEEGRYADLEYRVASGERRSTPPFSVIGWHPGDHLGCTCGFDMSLELIIT